MRKEAEKRSESQVFPASELLQRGNCFQENGERRGLGMVIEGIVGSVAGCHNDIIIYINEISASEEETRDRAVQMD